LAESVAGVGRAFELLNRPTEDLSAQPREILPRIRGHIILENVNFSYDGDRPVLRDINLELRHGEVTALVGASGSGKSTIASLILGFYRPCGGRVIVDGKDVATINLQSYRSQIAIVFQDNTIFSGTLRDNILLGLKNVSESEFIAACKRAHVDEFASRWPLKYGTPTGERGVQLSSGQRQRVALARAILRDPRVLILDEATANIDIEREIGIVDGLLELIHGRTTLIITHRLALTRAADQVAVLDNGRVVECGAPAELARLPSRYSEWLRIEAMQSLCGNAPWNQSLLANRVRPVAG
jgi:subfamily B ATP-binding cassette protein MsbA